LPHPSGSVRECRCSWNPRARALTSLTPLTIFEGTSEIQRMLIGRAVTGLDVR